RALAAAGEWRDLSSVDAGQPDTVTFAVSGGASAAVTVAHSERGADQYQRGHAAILSSARAKVRRRSALQTSRLIWAPVMFSTAHAWVCAQVAVLETGAP